MRLGNQVVLVRGVARSALYDLHRRRLVRIPAALSERIGPDGRIDLPESATGLPVLADLLSRKFIVKAGREHGSEGEGFRISRRYPLIPPLHTLSLEIGDRQREQIDWLTEAIALGVRFVTVFTGQGVNDQAFRTLSRISSSEGHAFRGFEIVEGRPEEWTRGTIYMANGRKAAVRHPASGRQAFHSKIRVDDAHFSLLNNYSELTGHVFMGRDLTLRPHSSEAMLVFGNASRLSPSGLRGTDAYTLTQSNSKAIREKCGGCELRFACVHPFSDRRDSYDIASAPVTCVYNPYDKDPQAELFN